MCCAQSSENKCIFFNNISSHWCSNSWWWIFTPVILSACLTVFFLSQGAGAVTCAWLCWRIKPPYTSRTRAPPLSDIISPTPAPSVPGPHPRWKTSDLLSVRSSTLCPDVAEPDCRSALEVLISTASVWGSNYHYHPEACRQTHTYCAYIQCRHTLSLLDCYTH